MAVKATGLSTTTVAWGVGSVCFLYPFFRMGAQLYVKSPAPLKMRRADASASTI